MCAIGGLAGARERAPDEYQQAAIYEDDDRHCYHDVQRDQDSLDRYPDPEEERRR